MRRLTPRLAMRTIASSLSPLIRRLRCITAPKSPAAKSVDGDTNWSRMRLVVLENASPILLRRSWILRSRASISACNAAGLLESLTRHPVELGLKLNRSETADRI